MIEYIEPTWSRIPALSEVYTLWKAHDQSYQEEPTEFWDFNEPGLDPETGRVVSLTPTVTTYYGHLLDIPYGVTLLDVECTNKIKLVEMTLHRADGDVTKELTVQAWQGDNNTLHLTQPLPDEDEILGPVNRKIFGKRNAEQSERKDYMLGRLYYGDTAVLDVDITKVVTPGRILRGRTAVK